MSFVLTIVSRNILRFGVSLFDLGKKQEVQEELPVEPEVPPGPEPGSKEWEYVDQPIDMVLMI